MNNPSLWHMSPTLSQLRNTEQKHGQDTIQVRALYSMVSTGTERLVALGKADFPGNDNMAVNHMEGSFKLPIKYGYSLVGIDNKQNLVHGMHPHQFLAYFQPDQLYQLPKNADPRRMTLISNMETVINAIWDAENQIKNTQLNTVDIAVCGFGNIGALLAMTLKQYYKCDITIVEQDPNRIALAEKLGFHTVNSRSSNLLFDLLFHTSANAKGLQWCIDQSKIESTIIELSWYGNKSTTINLGQSFHYNRVKIICSQVSKIPHSQPNESYLTRKNYAVKLLENTIYDSLIDDDIAFSKSDVFFNRLREKNHFTRPIQVLNYNK